MKLSPTSQKIGIVAAAIALIGLMVITIANLSRDGDKGNGTSTIYKDPVSGQTITQQDNKSPERGGPNDTGAADNQPTFAGFNVLLDKGYTLAELDATKKAFIAYKPVSDSAGLISLDVSKVRPGTPEETDPDERFYVTSDVVYRLDKKNTTYQMKLYHDGVKEVQLILKSADGSEQLYDSGKVTAAESQ